MTTPGVPLDRFTSHTPAPGEECESTDLLRARLGGPPTDGSGRRSRLSSRQALQAGATARERQAG